MVLDGCAFGIHNSQANCKYSLNEICLLYYVINSPIFIIESRLLPLNTENQPSIYIPIHKISLNLLLNFWSVKMLPGQQENIISICQLIDILFWYLYHHTQSICLHMSILLILYQIQKRIKHRSIVDFWSLGKFLMKYDIVFHQNKFYWSIHCWCINGINCNIFSF